MERDPRDGEAKKASPVYSPSDSEIDDVLWATHGINPRRQKSARIAKASDSSPVHSPLDSVIDDLLWTTYGINPRRQMVVPVYKPLTKDDLQSMSLEELKAAQARSVKRSDNLHAKMEMGMQYKEEHAEAKHGQEDFRKRLAKHFTAQSAKKQKQAEK